jgi:lipoprotein-anchoring transpeptidase ErfK/SrfK
MNPKFVEARELVIKAREALRRGDKPSAWKMGEQAAMLAPDMEDVWLILAAADSDPNEALAYAQKALEINPSSTRAHKAVEWATNQAKQTQVTHEAAVSFARIAPAITPVAETPQPKTKSSNRTLIFAASLFALLICAVLAFAAYSAVTHPAFASIFNHSPIPTRENHWASMQIPKPSMKPVDAKAFAQAASTPTAETIKNSPTPAPKEEAAATSAPTEAPTKAPSAAPAVTETPGTMAMSIVEDTPTSQYVAPQAPLPSGQLPSVAQSGDTRWIDVDLTQQAVYAYQGSTMVNSFIVSTGTWQYPTVTGQYNVYVKYRFANMHGPGYFLPDVPYVMYFYKSYGLHGTYWHHNFGHPMSHGCVNLQTDDAAWLFNWASIGTLVNVHY